jgi:hypothetical protein
VRGFLWVLIVRPGRNLLLNNNATGVRLGHKAAILIGAESLSWVVNAARRNYLGVRCVPIAEAQVTSFSVSFGENRRSDFTTQSLRCAQSGHWWHESERQSSANERRSESLDESKKQVYQRLTMCFPFSANTPWNRIRLTLGFGTRAASRAMKSSGLIIQLWC